MDLIINHSSMEPIYEQLSCQIRSLISTGKMKEGEPLPSEQAGFITTVHGKGSFVSSACQELFSEQQKREVEEMLSQAVRKGRSLGLSDQELTDTFELILEDLS